MVNKVEISPEHCIKSEENLNKQEGGGSHQEGGRFVENVGDSIQKSKYQRKLTLKNGLKNAGAVLKKFTFGPSKLLISNLDTTVSDLDFNKIFARIGPLKSIFLHCDSSGKLLGMADVTFERRADAVKAMKEYNGFLLNDRPMKIHLTTYVVSMPTKASFGSAGSRPWTAVGSDVGPNDECVKDKE